MQTVYKVASALFLLAGLTGCASNPLVGHGTTHAGRYNGNVGISGNGTTLTIQTGSNVPVLSIVGDGSKVTVEDGVDLRKIEFWGNANTVSIPANLQVMVSMMGTNQVIYRPTGSTQAGSATSKPVAGTQR